MKKGVTMKKNNFLQTDEIVGSDAEISESVRKRKAYLEKIIRDKEAALTTVPEGRLRVAENKGYHEFYLRTNPKDAKGRYMTKQERGLAKQIAQRDYDMKLLRAAKRECFAAANYLRVIEKNSIPELYEGLAAGRRAMVEPVRLPDDEFAKAWLTQEYEPYGFYEGDAEYYSDSGLRVRSKSEIIIANLLEKYKIPYKYECPMKLDRWGTVRPDFTCLNVRTRKEYLWEHLGMMDNDEYANKNIAKINAYEENGYLTGDCLILTFETSQIPINSNTIKSLIRSYLL